MTAPLVLRLSRDRAIVRLVQRAKTVWAAECPYGDCADLRHAIARLVQEKSLPRRQRFVRVELERSVIQVRTLRDVPPLGTRALRELVASHTSKFFRRPRDGSLCVAAAWLTRERHEATAVAVDRALVAAVVAGAAEASLTVVAIEPVGLHSAARLTLLPTSAIRRLRRTTLRQLGLVAALGAVLWGLAGAVYVTDLFRDRRAFATELDALREPLDGLARARRDLSETAGMVRQLEAVELERGWASGVLAALTAALPDSAFLQSLALDRVGQSRVIIAGVEPVAAMTVIEESGVARSARIDVDAEAPDGTVAILFRLRSVPGRADAPLSRSNMPEAGPAGARP